MIAGYLDYIERLIERRTTFTMQQLSESIHKFLEFNEYQILQNAGTVSHAQIVKNVEQEYEKFRKIQERQFESDFDREIKKIVRHRDPAS